MRAACRRGQPADRAGPDPRGRDDRQRQDHGRENCRGVAIEDEKVIRPFAQPLVEEAGFIVLSGNLFDAAIMKTSVISPSSASVTCRTPTT